jgi:hypothetical protein
MKPKDNELQRQRSGGDSGIGPRVSADTSSPSPLHPTPDPEPSTYFEIEQRRLHNPGEDKVGALPPQPPTSPWATDPVPDEPTIDRSDDGDVMGVPIDQLP